MLKVICFVSVFFGISLSSLAQDGGTSLAVAHSVTGRVFTPRLQFSELGRAWQDESGMIWGEALSEDGKCGITQSDARAFCAGLNIGARLPFVSDVIRLRKDMGATLQGPDGFKPEIFLDSQSPSFWLDEMSPDGFNSAFFSVGQYGSAVIGHLPEDFGGILCAV